MVRGAPLTQEQKQRLYNSLVVKKRSPEQSFDEVFDRNSKIISLSYITSMQKWFENNSRNVEALASYVAADHKKSHCGRKRKCSKALDQTIATFSKQQPKPSLMKIVRVIAEVTGEDEMNEITIRRSLKRSKITEKNITTISPLLNHEARNFMLRILSNYHVEKIHNFDESLAAMYKFIKQRARAYFGEDALFTDWYLPVGSKIYSVIGDYTCRGWAIWKIFWCNINHIGVERFLREDLAAVLTEGSVVLHDGASVHLTPSTQKTLEEVTDGNFVKGAAYSHDLFPVERDFANVWQYIRANWDPAEGKTPEEMINEAFFLYSTCGSRGYLAAGHFDIYKRNYELHHT